MAPVPLTYRLLLIGLLPLIAGVLYSRGQKYDPALIDFNTTMRQEVPGAALPQVIQTSQPLPVAQDIAGFQRMSEAYRYTKENLYEHVDGHAEYFISAGFQGLTVTEYIPSGSTVTQAEIQVEVYDMGKSIQAFGVLADESGENPPLVPVGTMGYKTSGGVNFIKGRYYVKISVFSPKTPVIKFAKGFADTLSTGQDSFQVFSKFPDLGKVESTRFVKEGYRGLDFLHNVMEREYSTGKGRIKVALMSGSDLEIRSLMSSFLDYFGKSGMQYHIIESSGRDVYRVIDKYEGNWFLIRSRDAIFGVFGTDDKEILKYFIEKQGGESS
ncbi:MAG TPA: hypothetical protein DDX85_05105 [Nitrospiraceae bacterium]|nr:hypothetical protein [Nitrospiraceae bacterium]